MPYQYVPTTGERKLEFWKTYRGGQYSEFVQVSADWNDNQIQEELEDWCGFQFLDSEFMRYGRNSKFIRYGWNDEVDFGSRV